MDCRDCGARVLEGEDLVPIYQINPYPFDPFGPNPETLLAGWSHAWHFRNETES